MTGSRLHSLLVNRFSFTLGAFLLIAVAWNVVVSLNNDGIITGQVLTAEGGPVSGATVTLSNKELLVTVVAGQTMTNEKGQFIFTDHRSHHIWLQAAKAGVGESPRQEFRMYFKGQNLNISEPLRIAATTPQGQ